MAGKQNNLSPEELARLEQIRAARMAAIKQGIDNLKNGQHRALEQLGFLNTETTDLADLSEEDLAKTKALFAQVFGQDPEDPSKGLLDNPALLSRFKFHRSPQNLPAELVKLVKAQLQASPKFAGREIPDAELLPYVQAELLRQMARPGSQLTYDDGKEKIENISVPVVLPVEEPEEKLAAIRDRSNQNGRKYFQLLQELRLMQVGAFELAASLAGKDPADIQKLAQVYDYLFGNNEQYALDQFRIVVNQGGLRESQSLEELYDEQYHGPEQTPEQKQAFQKAMLVNALANGSLLEVSHNGENLPALGDAFHSQAAPQSLRQTARQELTAQHNFSGANLPGCNNVPLEFGVAQIRQAVGEMLRNVNNCDKSYVRSSEAFITMKKHLKALNKLVNETWQQEIANNRPITLEMMSDFLDKADALKGDIRSYLDKKQADVAGDPSRRKDPKSYEQRRIQANITNLAALGVMTKRIENQVLKGISGKARDYFNKDLELLETRRPDLTAADAEEQKYNIQRTIDRQRQLSEDAYRRHTTFGKHENLLQARDRILGNVERKYDAAYYETLDQNKDIHNVVSKASSDQERRSRTRSNASLQKKYLSYFSETTLVASVDDPERTAVENYRYRLLPTDKKSLLENSNKNATVLPANQREGISFLEDLYGFTPNIKQQYLFDDRATEAKNKKNPSTGKYISILTDEPVRCDFKAIYRGDDPAAADAKLSEKDFVALAIVGATAPKSFAMSHSRKALSDELAQNKISQEEYDRKLFKMNDGFTTEEQRQRKVEDYTFSKVNYPYAPDAVCQEYFPCVQNGRKMASRAMEAYENGNLKPLAKLIAFGVTDFVAIYKAPTASQYQASVAEICKRMSNMLERDPELKKEAFKQGLKQQDLDMIDSFTMQNRIHNKAAYGVTLWQCRPDLVTGDVKLNIMADMYIDKIMQGEYDDLAHNVLDKQQSVVDAVAAAQQEYDDAMDAGDFEKGNILMLKQDLIHRVEARKLRYPDMFAETIIKPGVYDKLKEKVFKMLKQTELQNMNCEEYQTVLQQYGGIKADTGKTSTLSYLQNYNKMPQNEDGLYKKKEFLVYKGQPYEERAVAINAWKKENPDKYQQMVDEARQQGAQAGGLQA